MPGSVAAFLPRWVRGIRISLPFSTVQRSVGSEFHRKRPLNRKRTCVVNTLWGDAVTFRLYGRHIEDIQLEIVMDKGTTAIAVRGAAAMFLIVGSGATVGARASAPTPAAPAASAVSSEIPAPPGDSGGLTGGGALRVVPARLAPLPEPGGCIIGLDCGCIRGLTCPGSTPHRKPAPADGQPQGVAPPPAPAP